MKQTLLDSKIYFFKTDHYKNCPISFNFGVKRDSGKVIFHPYLLALNPEWEQVLSCILECKCVSRDHF